jgi:hypothetical protein
MEDLTYRIVVMTRAIKTYRDSPSESKKMHEAYGDCFDTCYSAGKRTVVLA